MSRIILLCLDGKHAPLTSLQGRDNVVQMEVYMYSYLSHISLGLVLVLVTQTVYRPFCGDIVHLIAYRCQPKLYCVWSGIVCIFFVPDDGEKF